MTTPLIIRVTGDPAPKGSNRAMLIGGKARFIPGGSKPNQAKLGSWKTAVTDEWRAAVHAPTPPGLEPIPFVRDMGMRRGAPIACGLVFRLSLRKGDLDSRGAPKPKAPLCVIVKPDVDKLTRSTFDALTTAGAWGDDSQVAFAFCAKLYVQPGAPTGCTITLGAIDACTLEGLGAVNNLWMSSVNDQAAQLQQAREAALASKPARRLR